MGRGEVGGGGEEAVTGCKGGGGGEEAAVTAGCEGGGEEEFGFETGFKDGSEATGFGAVKKGVTSEGKESRVTTGVRVRV